MYVCGCGWVCGHGRVAVQKRLRCCYTHIAIEMVTMASLFFSYSSNELQFLFNLCSFECQFNFRLSIDKNPVQFPWHSIWELCPYFELKKIWNGSVRIYLLFAYGVGEWLITIMCSVWISPVVLMYETWKFLWSPYYYGFFYRFPHSLYFFFNFNFFVIVFYQLNEILFEFF